MLHPSLWGPKGCPAHSQGRSPPVRVGSPATDFCFSKNSSSEKNPFLPPSNSKLKHVGGKFQYDGRRRSRARWLVTRVPEVAPSDPVATPERASAEPGRAPSLRARLRGASRTRQGVTGRPGAPLALGVSALRRKASVSTRGSLGSVFPAGAVGPRPPGGVALSAGEMQLRGGRRGHRGHGQGVTHLSRCGSRWARRRGRPPRGACLRVGAAAARWAGFWASARAWAAARSRWPRRGLPAARGCASRGAACRGALACVAGCGQEAGAAGGWAPAAGPGCRMPGGAQAAAWGRAPGLGAGQTGRGSRELAAATGRRHSALLPANSGPRGGRGAGVLASGVPGQVSSRLQKGEATLMSPAQHDRWLPTSRLPSPGPL